MDAAILSAHAHAPLGDPQIPPPVHVTFVDWVPGICSLLGMIVVNMIDKDRIRGDEGFGDSRAVWRARLFLFIGFALMAGGLAGSVVSVYQCCELRIAYPGRLRRRCLSSSTSSTVIRNSSPTMGMRMYLRTWRLCSRPSCYG